ncbi:MFS transporter [Paraburkholderia sp.]|uniref:MFS transporter n=1 Tax=Paraburkholderia sp. TaxID=1926495 RepID=UPI0039E5E522
MTTQGDRMDGNTEVPLGATAHSGRETEVPSAKRAARAAAAGPLTDANLREINVAGLIDARPLGRYQFVVLGLCLLVVLLDGFDTQTIGFLAPHIANALAIPLRQFGPVFGMGPLGMVVSAMIVGPIADHVGRKRMLIFATVCFGVGSLLTAIATTLPALIVARLVTGIGLGGVLPNVIALAAEFAPKRHARTCIAVMMCGLPAGSLAGGLVAAALLPAFGWKAAFYAGGLAPVVLALVLAAWMPESVRYLIARGADPARIARVLRAISPDAPSTGVRYVDHDNRAHGHKGKRVGARAVFTEGRAVSTVLLWIPYFMNLMLLYFSINWLPAIVNASGQTAALSLFAITSFNAGGMLGALSQGPVMNRFGPRPVLVSQCAITALYAVVLGLFHTNPICVVVFTAMAGYAVVGIQAGLNALSAEIYPTSIRATGAGWALGVGRLGSISGPLVGSVMIAMHWPPQRIFMAGVVPSLLALAAVAVLARRHR